MKAAAGGAALPSLSPLAAAVVSVESQLSCSVASVGPTWAVAEPPAEAEAPLLEAGAPAPPAASVAASDSDVVLVHWRAFFCRAGRQPQRHIQIAQFAQTWRSSITPGLTLLTLILQYVLTF